jgi:hypothetical protein
MKAIITTITALVLTTALSAETIKDIHVGASSTDLDNQTNTAYNIGYGVTKHTDSGIALGVSFDLGMISTDTEDIYQYGGDLKIGYTYRDLSVYALGSVLSQDLAGGTGLGFGYGAEIEYRITESFAASAQYKTYDMELEGVTPYDFSSSTMNVKYTF